MDQETVFVQGMGEGTGKGVVFGQSCIAL